jgi:transposase
MNASNSNKIKIMSKIKLHRVILSEKDREKLNDYIHRGKASVRSVTRARVLLLADSGRSDAEIVDALGISKSSVARLRKKYCQEGLESVLNEKPRSGAPPKISGKAKAQLTALACSEPPEGRSRWTLQLLADTLVELNEVDSISGMSVCRILKKMISSHGKRSSGA